MSAISQVGFDPGEIRTDQPTRSARLKWVIVVDDALPGGRAANAAALLAATTTAHVGGLLGPDAVDAEGRAHPGLPWAGCAVLGAPADRVAAIHARAAEVPGVFVAGLPMPAQATRVYDDYLRAVGGTAGADLAYGAVSLVGPRNRVDKLVHGLPLLR